ncbi:plasmid mobilization protein [Flavobacterium zhairuonense]|uniref:plasmid mobilization protein n=1 Tax=Flavobacterium zhairuonense TaxID=2493631 RepID=UPI002938FB75|nr:plasmid mobilization relaxosome protein MobC [Flavobacterium zhairuonense]
MEKETSKRTRIVGLRFTPEEYQKIERKWKASTCRKLSDYIRMHLFNKPITVKYRSESLDEFMAEVIKLKSELNALGNNFNQSVKKLHTLRHIPEFKSWILNSDFERKMLFDKVEEIKIHFQEITEKWLL